MRTIFLRTVDEVNQLARVTVARPRKTHRKSWMKFRVRHMIVPLSWLMRKNPKGGIVRLREFHESMLRP